MTQTSSENTAHRMCTLLWQEPTILSCFSGKPKDKYTKLKHIYEGKSLNNRKFYTRNNIFTRVLTEIVCVLFFEIAPLLRNTIGPPVHKLADAL